jgi:hypothetical protein
MVTLDATLVTRTRAIVVLPKALHGHVLLVAMLGCSINSNHPIVGSH